ncbi:uncharacterized protein DNG_06262 [Cephalotrichum gorgonifer]|uniref:Uncharacterized protein n=1 Tax=Cephalotrichum gorgonifer TaxID=2041049 RepID=A0AAE8N1C2_9PEZI|nr:uncharacterized protein DNG_06262 [Cephalotrichum gorgonifer]
MTPGNDAQRAFLTEGFTRAHALATFGESYTAEHQSLDGDQVFDWLFSNGATVRNAVRMSLQGVIENTTPVPEGQEPQGGPFADVRVYCTHDRITEGRKNRFFDKSIGEFLKAKFECSGALAWTMVPTDASKPDIVQMCPWFLDYAMKQKVQWQTQIGGGKIGSMISKLKLDKFATWAMYTPVDLFQLYEKVIVHELTHTRRGGQKADLDGFGGYGWKNARKLSTGTGERSPSRNADSLGLFASISGLIMDGGMVQENGNFVHGPSAETKKKKRGAFDAASLKGRPLF